MVDLDNQLVPKDAPLSKRSPFTAGFDFDAGFEVQTKAIKASSINVADLAVIANNAVTIKVPTIFESAVTLGSAITFPNPTYVGGSVSGTANMTVYGTLDVHDPSNRTDSIDEIPLRVRGGDNEVIIRYNLKVNNIYFYSNSSNGFDENYGPRAYLADGAGANAFSVQNSGGYKTFKAPSDGGVILTPISSAPTATEGAVYYDSSTHTLKYRDNAGWKTIVGSA